MSAGEEPRDLSTVFLQEIAGKNTEVGRLVRAYEVEALQTEACPS